MRVYRVRIQGFDPNPEIDGVWYFMQSGYDGVDHTVLTRDLNKAALCDAEYDEEEIVKYDPYKDYTYILEEDLRLEVSPERNMSFDIGRSGVLIAGTVNVNRITQIIE